MDLDEAQHPWPVGRRRPDAVKVGVVTVNWNTAGLLARLVFGLRRVVGPGTITEIVVVDNASTDGSVELARALAEAGVIHLIENPVQRYHGPGLTQAVNHLARCSDAAERVDLVWALDTDVFVLRAEVLDAAVAALEDSGAVLAADPEDYTPGPAVLTDGPLALCSTLFDPAAVWRPRYRPFLEDGEPSRHLLADLRGDGRPVLAFPFCSERYLLHLGRGTLAQVRARADTTNRYADWAAAHHEPHFAGRPDGADLAAGFEEGYRAAVPDDRPDTLVAALEL
jgi:glycosyltransferase involved in cell wall biosynthesis